MKNSIVETVKTLVNNIKNNQNVELNMKLEDKIDRLSYELYNLSDDEILIVNNKD